MYGTKGAAFDLSDVRAAAEREAYLQRQFALCQGYRRAAWAQGYRCALEDAGLDPTITDGVPVEVVDA